jgi:hypothetical protein
MTPYLVFLALLAAPSRAADLETPFTQARELLPLREIAPLAPKVCSALDFGGVSWPPSLTADDRAALEVALNISGSYEGSDGWGNITDDFDGQGLSLGLLNQCLGQGSLQPLLLRLRDEHPAVLDRLTPDHRRSLLDMLAHWQKAASVESTPAPLSLLDEPSEEGRVAPAGANSASVAWAVATLYQSGGGFDPVWKSELVALAASPEYVSLQIAAAVAAHDRAVADEARAGVRELRAYLFLYDVQVQNGGLYAADFDDYAAWRIQHPRADATARLEELLDLRVRHVRQRFAADVLSRKRAIIRGKGTVHGSARDLPAEYCYDGAWPYR